MSAHRFRAMGTDWWVDAADPALPVLAEAIVARLEACLSRFRPDSALSRLNAERQVEDPTLAAVLGHALQLRAETRGAFDPTLGAELAAWGYDRPFEQLDRPNGTPSARGPRPLVHVDGDRVRLEGAGLVDLGGIGKGWSADAVAAHLRAAGSRWVVVDAGGDLRVSGRSTRLAAADGSVVELDEGGLATSSTLRRRWVCSDGSPAHHLLDPVRGVPADRGVHTVSVRAATAAEADAWAKAILVRPGLTAALAARGGQAWLGDTHGRWWTHGEAA